MKVPSKFNSLSSTFAFGGAFKAAVLFRDVAVALIVSDKSITTGYFLFVAASMLLVTVSTAVVCQRLNSSLFASRESDEHHKMLVMTSVIFALLVLLVFAAVGIAGASMSQKISLVISRYVPSTHYAFLFIYCALTTVSTVVAYAIGLLRSRIYSHVVGVIPALLVAAYSLTAPVTSVDSLYWCLIGGALLEFLILVCQSQITRARYAWRVRAFLPLAQDFLRFAPGVLLLAFFPVTELWMANHFAGSDGVSAIVIGQRCFAAVLLVMTLPLSSYFVTELASSFQGGGIAAAKRVLHRAVMWCMITSAVPVGAILVTVYWLPIVAGAVGVTHNQVIALQVASVFSLGATVHVVGIVYSRTLSFGGHLQAMTMACFFFLGTYLMVCASSPNLTVVTLSFVSLLAQATNTILLAFLSYRLCFRFAVAK